MQLFLSGEGVCSVHPAVTLKCSLFSGRTLRRQLVRVREVRPEEDTYRVHGLRPSPYLWRHQVRPKAKGYGDAGLEIWPCSAQLNSMWEWDIWPILRLGEAWSVGSALRLLTAWRDFFFFCDTLLLIQGVWKCQQDAQSWVFATEFPSQASIQESEGQGLCTAAAIQGSRAQIPSESNTVQSVTGRRGSACPYIFQREGSFPESV